VEQARNNVRAAVDVVVELLGVDPYNFAALIRLGGILAKAGRTADAAKAYQRVLHFDPGQVEALAGLQRLMMSLVRAAG
jgi:Flp pilus assembly protein TadD